MQHARSYLWSFVNSIGTKGLSFVIFAIMGRLLTPEDFGVVAWALIICAVVDVLADMGLTEALVQKGDRSPRLLSACLLAQGLAAMGYGVLIYAVASVLPNEWLPQHFLAVLPWMLAASVFTALSAAALADLRLQLDFQSMAKRSFAGTVVGGLVGIWSAWSGAGALSLAWMTVANAATACLVAFLLCDFRLVVRQADRGALTGLLRFSRSILGARLVETIFARVDQFFIGAVFGPVILGLYAFAFRLYEILLTVTAAPIGEVLLSTLSRLKADRQALSRQYRFSAEMSAAFVSPVFLFSALTAQWWLPLVFGEQWLGAVVYAQFLLGFGAMHGVGFTNGITMTAYGRPQYRFMLAVLSAGVWAVIFFPGMWLGAPDVYAVYTTAARWTVMVTLQFVIVCMLLRLPPGTLFLALWKPVAGMACAALGILAVAEAMPLAEPAVLMAVAGLAATLIHLAVLKLTRCAALAQVEGLVAMKLGRSA